MASDLATVAPPPIPQPQPRFGADPAAEAAPTRLGSLADKAAWDIAVGVALARAGFRRYATYRQAIYAASFTNTVFGLLRCYVLLAVVPASGLLVGYDRAQLATYCWLSQGLIGVVGAWGWTELADRIRSGEVIADLQRPINPVASYLYPDLGRAGVAMLTRFVVPIAVGAAVFTLYAPREGLTYPLFAVSLLLSVLVSFGSKFLLNACAYWLLDLRGVNTLWMICSFSLTGLAFPLHFLPTGVVRLLWIGTPFPSIMQAPLDVAVEHGSTGVRLLVVAVQAVWAVLLLALCWLVQRAAQRRLVIQGG